MNPTIEKTRSMSYSHGRSNLEAFVQYHMIEAEAVLLAGIGLQGNDIIIFSFEESNFIM